MLQTPMLLASELPSQRSDTDTLFLSRADGPLESTLALKNLALIDSPLRAEEVTDYG